MSAREIVRLMNEEESIVVRALYAAEEAIAVAIEKAAETFQRGGRIIYLGSGTSGRIALTDAAEMPPTFGLDPCCFIALVSGGTEASSQAVEDAEDDPHSAIEALNELRANRKDIVIGLAASGTTPFVLGGVRHAQQKGIWTCGISNNRAVPLLDAVDHQILLETGPEVLTGSTRLKAGTSQKMALNRISTGAMVLSGKVVENLMVDVKAKNAKLKDRCARIVKELAPLTYDEAWEMLEDNDWNIRRVLEAAKPSPERISSIG